MALGAGAVSKKIAAGTPRFHEHITVAGDGAYAAGGTAGFKAYFEAIVGAQREILAVIDQSDPSTVSRLEYDHTNDKLFARVRTTGAESAVADQSAVTYRLLVISK